VPEKKSIVPKNGIVRAGLAFIAVFLLVLGLDLVVPHFSLTVWWWWVVGIAAAFLAYRGRI